MRRRMVVAAVAWAGSATCGLLGVGVALVDRDAEGAAAWSFVFAIAAWRCVANAVGALRH